MREVDVRYEEEHDPYLRVLYSYDGYVETAEHWKTVHIYGNATCGDGSGKAFVYKGDIPNLIKALRRVIEE